MLCACLLLSRFKKEEKKIWKTGDHKGEIIKRTRKNLQITFIFFPSFYSITSFIFLCLIHFKSHLIVLPHKQTGKCLGIPSFIFCAVDSFTAKSLSPPSLACCRLGRTVEMGQSHRLQSLEKTFFNNSVLYYIIEIGNR